MIGSSYAPGLIDFLASQNDYQKEIESVHPQRLVESSKKGDPGNQKLLKRFKSGQQNTVKVFMKAALFQRSKSTFHSCELDQSI